MEAKGFYFMDVLQRVTKGVTIDLGAQQKLIPEEFMLEAAEIGAYVQITVRMILMELKMLGLE